ncbi:GMC oxidoreductase [Fulvivirga sedimenti]|uniref:GMC family oxidoreductase n=1 Tax=Fulvivirga sedimenti TaxID=2879465 RepID=A0A9X1HWT3_9BACT|nr:GMC family oxidoreductase [Fulvivirga sedimenti]MCA6078835.1 GMC family oxidoreductase [Fulvivirga sedimenti]
MNLETTKKKRTYDAIVIGSGASGGWAAKELCEKGLRTLVLDRGRDVRHIEDYPTASKAPYDFEFRGTVPLRLRGNHRNGWALNEATRQWVLPEDEQPFIQEKPFRWFRGYHVGGKSLLWARQTQRWSDLDFEGPVRDGFAVDWPIRYKDLEPWYDHVERFIGVAGANDGLAELPDSISQPPFDTSCIEQHFRDSIRKHYGNERHVIQARCAHLTDPQPVHYQQGRTRCMNQDMCNRGCIYGGYFSSNASTLPWAAKTGKMTLRPNSIVHSIIYKDKKRFKNKARGVRVIDRLTGEMIDYYAKIIFVNASTLNTNSILLNSVSSRYPNGLGNDNDLLGKYISWHNYRGKANAEFEGLQDKTTSGRSPTNSYIPRFRNLYNQETDFLRGYAIGIGGGRGMVSETDVIGDQLRDNLLNPKPGIWHISSWMMGETVPIESNHVRLSREATDKYGIPQLIVSCEWTENDDKMVKDYIEQSEEMFRLAGFTNIRAVDTHSPPGSDIHEMGGVRMGNDPATSLVNKWNQLHTCKNVFVTDGACMTSTGTQNPTLTFMAITARAANYAVEELNKQNL